MSSQLENSQSSEHLKTIRLSFPKTIATNIKQMRLVNNDLVLYVPESDVEKVTKAFTSHEFDLVEREYKLHVSSNTEQEFDNMVSIPRGCVNGRYIYTVTVNNQAKYDELINSSLPECTFKPFRFRFSKSSNINQDDDSDTKDQVNSNQRNEWTPVAKSKNSKQQPRQYQDRRLDGQDRRLDGQDRRLDGQDRQQNRQYQGGRQDGNRRQPNQSQDRRQSNQTQNRQQGSSQNTKQQSNNA